MNRRSVFHITGTDLSCSIQYSETEIIESVIITGKNTSPTQPTTPHDLEHFFQALADGRHFILPDVLFRFPSTLSAVAKQTLLLLKNTVPAGTTVTYGELGSAVSLHPRAVGSVLRINPFPILIPCHRVVPKNGVFGRFTAPGGTKTKKLLLAYEQARSRPVSRSQQ